MSLNALFKCTVRKCRARFRRDTPPTNGTACPVCGSLYVRWLNAHKFEVDPGEPECET